MCRTRCNWWPSTKEKNFMENHGMARCLPSVVFLEGHVDHKKYIQKCLPVAKKYWTQFFSSDWTFRQDGATSHTEKTTQEWCKTNLPWFIPKDRWPANSPDLNPLDYAVWMQICNLIRWRRVTDIDGLKFEIRRAVRLLDQKTLLDNCKNWYTRVSSLPARDGEYIR